MGESSQGRVGGLNHGAGIVLFATVTTVAYVVANPRFPNEHGPMPKWLPYVAFALVLSLAAAAMRHAGWRRVARGFVLGYVITFALTRGGCTGVWTDMAVRLDPTREARRAARLAATQESTRQRERPQRIAEARSPSGRAYLARTMDVVAGCAFAYRDAMPGDGFPRSLEELGMPGGLCAHYVGASGGVRLEVLSPPGPDTRPATTLRLRLGPPAHLGIAYPLYELDERGIVTVRDTSTDAPLVVASPVPALLELRRCLLAAVPSPYRADSLSLLGLLAEGDSVCVALHSQTMRDETIMELSVRVDSRIVVGDDPAGARYVVRYVPVRRRPDEGFMLLAAAEGQGASRRRYLVTVEGHVHATAGARDATDADAPPVRCEMDPTVACE